MIKYSALLTMVAERAGTADTEEAKRAAEAVLGVVAMVLDEPTRSRVAQSLPGELRVVTEVKPAGAQADVTDVVRTVAEVLRCPPERARYYTQGVLSAFTELDPGLAQQLRLDIPGGDELVTPVGHGVAPRGSAVPTTSSPELLDQQQIDRELATLPGWDGDQRRLRRTVGLPPERIRPLLDAVTQAEQELDHHARTEQTADGLTFELWTHSLDRVTDLDIALARRISEAVERVGSAG